jgi:hypothetical protein
LWQWFFGLFERTLPDTLFFFFFRSVFFPSIAKVMSLLLFLSYVHNGSGDGNLWLQHRAHSDGWHHTWWYCSQGNERDQCRYSSSIHSPVALLHKVVFNIISWISCERYRWFLEGHG